MVQSIEINDNDTWIDKQVFEKKVPVCIYMYKKIGKLNNTNIFYKPIIGNQLS